MTHVFLFMQSILVHKVISNVITCACILERAGLTVSIFKVAAVQVVTKSPVASVRVSHLSGKNAVDESKKKPKIKSPHKCPWQWRGQIHHLERWFRWIHYEEILPLWQYDTNRVRNITTHCLRQNGPESWVLLTKVKSLGHIASSYKNLDQISSSEFPL